MVCVVWFSSLTVAMAAGLRPPAVPLVTHDPYFSIWSCTNHLTDAETRHWTGTPHPLTSLVRIDGKAYRLMGEHPSYVPAMPQTDLTVLPTRTIYEFRTAEARLRMTFLSPALPHKLDVLSRPLTYVTWEVASLDGREHAVSVYFDASAVIAVDKATQAVTWSREQIEGLCTLKIGSKDQPILAKAGDNLRIDWGYLYVAAPREGCAWRAIVSTEKAQDAFLTQGPPPADDPHQPRPAAEYAPVAAMALDLGQVGAKVVSRYLMIAYDDIESIEYFHQKLRPYWRRNGSDAAKLLTIATAEYAAIEQECASFDADLMADLAKAGGTEYAQLASLAYRQCFAGNKLAADSNGQPLLFPKENFSNGCIATVDVIYPMDPFFLLLSPTLTKASLEPILDYAISPRWRFPFAPHDLGTYPKANGQVYGGGERTETNQMPVEESGNMILLLAALAKIEGNAAYTDKYWPAITRWAEYLKAKGLDPENQLCTDDFAGHLAHNVNLSAKAIEALGAYALLCQMRGQTEPAQAYRQLACQFAAKWSEMAVDGDHYRLAFDKPGTWSQKYNLVWDRILGLNLFSQEVFQKEMTFYKKTQKRFGLPLDNRKDYTKLDWTLWTACLTQSREDFAALVSPVYQFLQASPSRVPMTDWYHTPNATMVGFQARPVVGGVYLRLLYDPDTWKKWATRDKTPVGPWAPLPAAH